MLGIQRATASQAPLLARHAGTLENQVPLRTLSGVSYVGRTAEILVYLVLPPLLSLFSQSCPVVLNTLCFWVCYLETQLSLDLGASATVGLRKASPYHG